MLRRGWPVSSIVEWRTTGVHRTCHWTHRLVSVRHGLMIHLRWGCLPVEGLGRRRRMKGSRVATIAEIIRIVLVHRCGWTGLIHWSSITSRHVPVIDPTEKRRDERRSRFEPLVTSARSFDFACEAVDRLATRLVDHCFLDCIRPHRDSRCCCCYCHCHVRCYLSEIWNFHRNRRVGLVAPVWSPVCRTKCTRLDPFRSEEKNLLIAHRFLCFAELRIKSVVFFVCDLGRRGTGC